MRNATVYKDTLYDRVIILVVIPYHNYENIFIKID